MYTFARDRSREGRKEGKLWGMEYCGKIGIVLEKGTRVTFESEIERVDFLKRKVIIIAYR